MLALPRWAIGSLVAILLNLSSVRGRFRAGRRNVKITAGCREAAAGQHRGGQQQVGGAAGDSGFDAQLGLVGLGVMGHVLRSRRLYENVAVAAIVLGALRGIGHDNRVSIMAHLQAWDKREVQRLERKAARERPAPGHAM